MTVQYITCHSISVICDTPTFSEEDDIVKQMSKVSINGPTKTGK